MSLVETIAKSLNVQLYNADGCRREIDDIMDDIAAPIWDSLLEWDRQSISGNTVKEIEAYKL